MQSTSTAFVELKRNKNQIKSELHMKLLEFTSFSFSIPFSISISISIPIIITTSILFSLCYVFLVEIVWRERRRMFGKKRKEKPQNEQESICVISFVILMSMSEED